MCFVGALVTRALYTAVNHVNEQGILQQKLTQLMQSCREEYIRQLSNKVQATTANTSSISLIHRDYPLHLLQRYICASTIIVVVVAALLSVS